MLVCVYPIANKYTWCVLYLIIIYMSMTFLHYGPPLNPTRMYAYSYYRVLASIVINATVIVSAAINSVSDSCTLFALSRHMWSSPRCYNYQPQLVDDGC